MDHIQNILSIRQKKQKPIQDKKNYIEKIDNNSAHTQTIETIKSIEDYLFHIILDERNSKLNNYLKPNY